VIISKKFENKTRNIGSYYNTNYNNITLAKETKNWLKTKYTKYPILTIPNKNILIPTNFDLIYTTTNNDAIQNNIKNLENKNNNILEKNKNKNIEKIIEKQRLILLNKPPVIIRNDEKWKIWYKLDQYFKQPKVYAVIALALPVDKYDAKFAINAKLFAACLFENINEFLYDARIAGLNFEIDFTSRGVNFIFSGFFVLCIYF
jgi:secreted Zn-dependent insulinase-like peptidase